MLLFVMALLASRGFDTPRLSSQGRQRRSRFLNIGRVIPNIFAGGSSFCQPPSSGTTSGTLSYPEMRAFWRSRSMRESSLSRSRMIAAAWFSHWARPSPEQAPRTVTTRSS